MIKFFRKIRQRLLAENRLGKYLIYAIGEIILVVIGILIAIQINTWNNERIANLKMKSYLHNIEEDLKADTLQFNRIINISKGIINDKKKLLSLSQFENISTDSLWGIIVPQSANYNLITTTFTKITNLGVTEISKNDSLSKKLYGYYTTELEYFNVIINWEVKNTSLESKYWIYDQDKYVINDKDEFPKFQDEYTNRQNLINLISHPKGRNYLFADYDRKQRVLLTYQNMKEIADELIEEIQKELGTTTNN